MLKTLSSLTYTVIFLLTLIVIPVGVVRAEDMPQYDSPASSRTVEPLTKKDSPKNTETATDINAYLETLSDDGVVPFERKTTLAKPKKKLDILVRAEPGDSLVKLSWNVIGVPTSSDLEGQQYVVNYGTESGKLTKSINVGKGTSFILRGLKNHQVYFVQISTSFPLSAQDRDKATGDREEGKQLLLKSEELKTIPLPEEEIGGSPLEKSFLKKNPTLQDAMEAESFKRELKQFGYEFFKNTTQLAMAMENLPVGGDYIIGPGDTISLTLWGSINLRQELTVSRTGEISIPKIGAVSVWGLSFDQAKATINKAVARYYKNFESTISLGKLRSIQVFVVGEVEFPGGYPVSALATVVNALSAAGGPTKNGSLRSVKISRSGKPAVEVDLYEILLKGDRASDFRLQNGDTIFVPVIGKVAAVAGEVKRPAIYELKDEKGLRDVIAMAGGVTASGSLSRIQVERFSANNSRVLVDYTIRDGKIENASAEQQVQDRDMIKVFPVQEAVRQVVTLKGNVVRPGEYQFQPGMRVLDVIRSYDALLPESYLESAEITRLAQPDYHKELITFNLRQALEGNSTDNVLLQEQDAIKIHSRSEMTEQFTVAVNGEVVNPGHYPFFLGMTVRDLVAAAGSLKRNALVDRAELSRVLLQNGKASSAHRNINLAKALAGDPDHNLTLQPDDSLSIRAVTDWLDATDKFVTLTGEVMYPGIYAISRGEKISSIIQRAGGFTSKAYLAGAKFTRKSVKKIQQKRMDEVIGRTEKEIYQKMAALSSTATSKEEVDATRSALEGLLKQLDILKKTKAEGRVVIRISTLNELNKSSFNLDLEGGDTLDIPARPSVVHVMGQVYNPTSFVYVPENSTVSNYLGKAGGPTRDGEESDMYIIRADGSVISKQQSSFGLKWNDDSRSWSFGSFDSTHMMPGDTLVMPQKLDRIAWIREIKDITTIISQIALTAGTVLIGLR